VHAGQSCVFLHWWGADFCALRGRFKTEDAFGSVKGSGSFSEKSVRTDRTRCRSRGLKDGSGPVAGEVPRIAAFFFLGSANPEPQFCRIRPATGAVDGVTTSCAKRGMECPSVCTAATFGSSRSGICMSTCALNPVGVFTASTGRGKSDAELVQHFLDTFRISRNRYGVEPALDFFFLREPVLLFLGRDRLNEDLMSTSAGPKGARIPLHRGTGCRPREKQMGAR
jgi:hypothetical protein